MNINGPNRNNAHFYMSLMAVKHGAADEHPVVIAGDQVLDML